MFCRCTHVQSQLCHVVTLPAVLLPLRVSIQAAFIEATANVVTDLESAFGLFAFAFVCCFAASIFVSTSWLWVRGGGREQQATGLVAALSLKS